MRIIPFHSVHATPQRRPVFRSGENADDSSLADEVSPERQALFVGEWAATDAVEDALTHYLEAHARTHMVYAQDVEGTDYTPNFYDPRIHDLAKKVARQLAFSMALLAENVFNDSFYDLLAEMEQPEESEEPAPVIARRGRLVASPSLSRQYRRPTPTRFPRVSSVATTVDGLDEEGQKLYEANFEACMRSARAWARRDGLTEAEAPEVEAVAEKALQRAAANFNPEHDSHATFKTFLLSGLYRDVRKATARIKRRRGEIPEGQEVEDAQPGVEQKVSDRELKRILGELLERLPPRQRQVMEGFHGLGGEPRKTLADLAHSMNLHPVTVRREHTEGLRRLREMLENRGLELAAFVGSRLLRYAA